MDVDLNAIVVALQDVTITRYVCVAGVTLCIYEFILNLHTEIEYVWSKPIRLGQVLYLLNRYISSIGLCIAFAFLLWPPRVKGFCGFWPYFMLVQFGLATLWLQLVLVVRVCALYKDSRVVRVIAVVGCIAVVCETVAIGIVTIVDKSWLLLSLPGTTFNMCVPSQEGFSPQWRYVYWIYPIVYQTFLFILVVGRAWFDLGFGDSKSLIQVIVRDSSLTFLWNLIIQLISIFIWRYDTHGGLFETPAMMGNALDVALATRLLLNMWVRFYEQKPSISTIIAAMPSARSFPDFERPASSTTSSFWAY